MLRKDLRFRVRYVIALACTICFWLDTERGNFAFYIMPIEIGLICWCGFWFWFLANDDSIFGFLDDVCE